MTVLARKGAHLPESAATLPPELSTGPFNYAAEVMYGTTDPLLTGAQCSYGPTD